MAITHRTLADNSFTPRGKIAWEETHSDSAIVRSGDFGSAALFNTAQAALTETVGVAALRVGTGAGVGITWPSLGTAPFQSSVGGGTFNGTFDPQFHFAAYNYAQAIAGEPTLGFVLEGHYFDGVDRWMELNFDYTNAAGNGKRFLAFQINRATDAVTWAMAGGTIRLETAMNASELVLTTASGNITRSVADGAVTTAATVITALQLNNTTGGSGTLSPAIAFNVGGGGGIAKIYTERLGGSGGVLHFATDDSAGTITDRWEIDESGHLTNNSTGAIRAAAGSNTSPGFGFASQPDRGFFLRSASSIDVAFGTSNSGFTFQTTALTMRSTSVFAWSSTADAAQSPDLILARDAANTLALKNSTAAQIFNHYGSEITASTRYSRLAIKHATTTLNSVNGATVTATNLIPAKANVLGVNTVVTVSLGTGGGTTGYTVGDGSDADRWGAVTGTDAGTDTDGNDATADPTGWFTAANNVVITAAGGNFNGTGSIFVDVAYTITEAD